jgi:hypothetical protein
MLNPSFFLLGLDYPLPFFLLIFPLFPEHLLHAFKFFKALCDLAHHLVAFFLFFLELQAQDRVLRLYFLHALLVFLSDLHDLFDGDGLFRRFVFVVNADHVDHFCFQFLGLALIVLSQLGCLKADLVELLDLFFCEFLLLFLHWCPYRLVLFHSNIISKY